MDEMHMTVETDRPVNPSDIPANTTVIVNAAPKPVTVGGAKSRAGITKKIARPAAEKKARKLAKARRQQNRRHNSHNRG